MSALGECEVSQIAASSSFSVVFSDGAMRWVFVLQTPS